MSEWEVTMVVVVDADSEDDACAEAMQAIRDEAYPASLSAAQRD